MASHPSEHCFPYYNSSDSDSSVSLCLISTLIPFRVHLNNLPILKSLITSAKSLLPYNIFRGSKYWDMFREHVTLPIIRVLESTAVGSVIIAEMWVCMHSPKDCRLGDQEMLLRFV